MSRVLLVSHEASRTGAPRIAALVASCLVEHGHRVRIVSQRPGPLVQDFAEVAPTRVPPLWRVLRRLWARPGAVRSRVARVLETTVAVLVVAAHRPDLVYVNSTSSAGYVRAATLLRRRAVLHVHESGEVLATFLARVGYDGLPEAGVRLVACSPSVRSALEAAGAGPDRLDVLLSIPDAERVLAGAASALERVRGDGASEVVVGSCGAVEHRKGADLWLEVARSVVGDEGGERFRFVWIGEGDGPSGAVGARHVEFRGASDNPYAAMAEFDVMTLPSRDDPFPLVVMEAMLLAKPVVAFDVGGVAHQLGETGVLVPAGDVCAFAREVALLGADPVRRSRLGAAAAARADELFSRAAFDETLLEIVARAQP